MKLALRTEPVRPLSSAISLPLSASQMRAQSEDAVTTRLPSGMKPALCTPYAWPLSSAISVPPSAFQMRAVLSADAVTTRLPSGLKPALRTESVWPLSRAISVPLSASQMRAVLAADAVTTRLPSGLKPALCTAPVWPLSRAMELRRLRPAGELAFQFTGKRCEPGDAAARRISGQCIPHGAIELLLLHGVGCAGRKDIDLALGHVVVLPG